MEWDWLGKNRDMKEGKGGDEIGGGATKNEIVGKKKLNCRVPYSFVVRQEPRPPSSRRRQVVSAASIGPVNRIKLTNEKTEAVVRLGQKALQIREEKFLKEWKRTQNSFQQTFETKDEGHKRRMNSKLRYLNKLRTIVNRHKQQEKEITALRSAVADVANADEYSRVLEERMKEKAELMEKVRLARQQARDLMAGQSGLQKMEKECHILEEHVKSLSETEQSLREQAYERDEKLRVHASFLAFLRKRLSKEPEGEELKLLTTRMLSPEKDMGNWTELGTEFKTKSSVKKGERRAGEELDAPWRAEMGKVVANLMSEVEAAMETYYWVKASAKCRSCSLLPERVFVLKRTGEIMCPNCVQALGDEEHNEFFEDPNFASILSRLEMNVQFESSIDAVLTIFKDDLQCIRSSTISQLRTRFGIYASILYLRPGSTYEGKSAGSAKEDKAHNAATRIARIWRERAKRLRALERASSNKV